MRARNKLQTGLAQLYARPSAINQNPLANTTKMHKKSASL